MPKNIITKNTCAIHVKRARRKILKRTVLFGTTVLAMFTLTACSSNNSNISTSNPSEDTYISTKENDPTNASSTSSEKTSIPESELEDSSITNTTSVKTKSKQSGYKFNVTGTGNEEGKHIVTSDEAGEYQVECFDVPVSEKFYEYPDSEDLMAFVTVFPDDGNYDIAMDADKAIYNDELCTAANICEFHKYGIKTAHYSTTMDLQKGNKIMVLNGSVKFTKK